MSIERGMSLREATSLWRSMGGAVDHIPRTGELRFTHPSHERTVVVNGRRKDAPVALVSRLRQLRGAQESE